MSVIAYGLGWEIVALMRIGDVCLRTWVVDPIVVIIPGPRVTRGIIGGRPHDSYSCE